MEVINNLKPALAVVSVFFIILVWWMECTDRCAYFIYYV